MGWSMYSMLAYSLKPCGFKVGVLEELFAKLHGPVSCHNQLSELSEGAVRTWNNPTMEERPGPPLNHAASGTVVALCLASKNQKKRFSFPVSSFSFKFP